jgi:hypothetical protein
MSSRQKATPPLISVILSVLLMKARPCTVLLLVVYRSKIRLCFIQVTETEDAEVRRPCGMEEGKMIFFF